VLVGHNVGFDAAMLRREAAVAGIAWAEPPTLCLTQIEALLAPDGADLGLDAMAARRGIDVHGRHTALGDVLVTAEIFFHMLPVLAARGVTTFGQATDFAARAATVIRDQRAAGWFADAPTP
jgi:DNA polymerase III epsilon subunit-like protein